MVRKSGGDLFEVIKLLFKGLRSIRKPSLFVEDSFDDIFQITHGTLEIAPVPQYWRKQVEISLPIVFGGERIPCGARSAMNIQSQYMDCWPASTLTDLSQTH
jgi:hypothetical protein